MRYPFLAAVFVILTEIAPSTFSKSTYIDGGCLNRNTQSALKAKTGFSSIVDLMLYDFPTFKSHYEAFSGDRIGASHVVQYRQLLSPVDSWLFIFNKGYAVIGDNLEFYCLSSAQLPSAVLSLKTEGLIYSDGWFYKLDQYGIRSPVWNDESFTSNVSNSADTSPKIGIDDAAAHCEQYYPGYDFVSSGSIEGYIHSYQFDNSIYVGLTDDSAYAEGNCVMNAIYSMFLNIGKRGLYDSFYRNNYFVPVDVGSDSQSYLLYDSQKQNTYPNSDGELMKYIANDRIRIGKPNKGMPAITNFPTLYKHIRDIAVQHFDYLPYLGIATNTIPALAKASDSFYSYDVQYIPNSDQSSAIALVDAGYPTLYVVSDEDGYKNHAMNIIGYYIVQKTTGWWIFSQTDEKVLWQVDDGWEPTPEDSYYDPMATSAAMIFMSVDYTRGTVTE